MASNTQRCDEQRLKGNLYRIKEVDCYLKVAMIGWKGRGALIEADTTGFDWPLSIESAAIVKSANRGLIHQRLSTADRQSIVRSKSRIEMRHRYLRVLLFVIVATGTIDGPDRSSCTEFYRVSEFRSS